MIKKELSKDHGGESRRIQSSLICLFGGTGNFVRIRTRGEKMKEHKESYQHRTLTKAIC